MRCSFVPSQTNRFFKRNKAIEWYVKDKAVSPRLLHYWATCMLTKENNCKVAHKFCNTSQQRGLLGSACIEMKDKV